jgi:hypothetical protein
VPAHFVRRRPELGFKVQRGTVGRFLTVSLRHDAASVRWKVGRGKKAKSEKQKAEGKS